MAEEKRVEGLALLDVAVTPALAAYLSDHYSMLEFEAYLWKMIVAVDYGKGGSTPAVVPGEPESAVGRMKSKHSRYLAEMEFCRAVNSFQTYLAELLTLIFEARPETLKSKKMVSREFCVEHHFANDLIAALAEQTVNELAYQGLKDLADFFGETLHLPLFMEEKDLEAAALNVDIRNLITHNRGIVNRFFLQRHPDYPTQVGARIGFANDDVRDIIGTFVYFGRQVDLRAIEKFKLKTLQRIPRDQTAS